MERMVADNKMQVVKIIEHLSESRLRAIADFASYLKEKEKSEDILKMQMGSEAYQDWLNPENDIYDEVFKNDV